MMLNIELGLELVFNRELLGAFSCGIHPSLIIDRSIVESRTGASYKTVWRFKPVWTGSVQRFSVWFGGSEPDFTITSFTRIANWLASYKISNQRLQIKLVWSRAWEHFCEFCWWSPQWYNDTTPPPVCFLINGLNMQFDPIRSESANFFFVVCCNWW